MIKTRLTDIKLNGLGNFEESPATFSCRRHSLAERWDYVYSNEKILLRIDHAGCGYLQVDPPGGPALFKPERWETVPCWGSN